MKRQISKTKIEKRMKGKTNTELVRTIIKLKKTNPLIAKLLARPIRNWDCVNLEKMNKVNGDVLVVGKVLSLGNLEKGKKVVAWGASKKAIEKIKAVKGEFVLLTNEIKKNPELKDLNLIK